MGKLALEGDSFWFAHRNACIVAAVRRFPPSGPIFDVGGGNGVVALALERAGFETVLVEPGPQGAANARARGLSHVVCSTLEDAGVRPRTLSAVGLFDVVEHLADDVAFLRSTGARMAPGARLYLTAPAYLWLWSSEDDYAGHYRRYSGRGLSRALRAAGFEIEYQTHFFVPLPVPILLFRTVPTRLGRRGVDARKWETREHRRPAGPAAGLLDRLLGIETRAIARGLRLPLGSSCLAVARVASSAPCRP